MFSNECTGVGLSVPKDRGKKFLVCAAARKNQGGSIPALKMKEWCQKFNHALDHCLRTELTTSDLTEAKLFTVVETQFLSDYGVDLREESKTQISYYLHIENLHLKLKKVLTQSINISTSVPGTSSFLQYAASLYESFPEFRDSLIVALINASINITM